MNLNFDVKKYLIIFAVIVLGLFVVSGFRYLQSFIPPIEQVHFANSGIDVSIEIGQPISIPDGYELLGYSFEYNRGICRHIETGQHFTCSYHTENAR